MDSKMIGYKYKKSIWNNIIKDIKTILLPKNQ